MSLPPARGSAIFLSMSARSSPSCTWDLGALPPSFFMSQAPNACADPEALRLSLLHSHVLPEEHSSSHTESVIQTQEITSAVSKFEVTAEYFTGFSHIADAKLEMVMFIGGSPNSSSAKHRFRIYLLAPSKLSTFLSTVIHAAGIFHYLSPDDGSSLFLF